jgi:XTP/dITP diphosphohydrolase
VTSARTSEWVLATTNQGKLSEFRAILGPRLMIHAQHALAVTTADETGCTFLENALIKARHAAEATGLPSIADDSGLLVDALGGAPGVRSARYAGPNASDAENVACLLDALRGVAPERRGAQFYCVIVALLSARDPCPLVATGVWRGVIADAPAGKYGFGYDPVFFDPAQGATAAELAPDLKNRVSHRARALGQLAALLTGEAPPA